MRAAVSTLRSPPYGILKYLVKVKQPTLNKNKHRVLDSSSLVEKAKEWNMSLTNIQTSFDVVHLHPSVPIDEPVAVIIEILNNGIDDLWKRTKLITVEPLCYSFTFKIFVGSSFINRRDVL